jgi:hypothetical protein
MYDNSNTLFAPITGLPFPIVLFEHFEPARTYAVGLNLMLSHRFKLTPTVADNSFGDYQINTNGDTIRGYDSRISKIC